MRFPNTVGLPLRRSAKKTAERARSDHGRMIVCPVCQRGDGTLLKVGPNEYRHRACLGKKAKK